MNILSKVAAVFRRKAAPGGTTPVIASSIGNFTTIRDWMPGVWQRGLPPLTVADAVNDATVYACQARLAGDFSLMKPRVQINKGGIWSDMMTNSTYLEMPNLYETSTQFWEHFITSLLTCGNTFVYMRGDGWFILNPQRVRVLVATDGSGQLFYDCSQDLQCGVTENVILSGADIIHARINARMDNPALGIPPLFAASLAGQLGADAKNAAENIYANASRPGGIIEVPGAVNIEKLTEIKTNFEGGYSGSNRGKTAVLSDGMKFVAFDTANMVDNELISALRLSAEQIASIYGVPLYKIGRGSYPPYAGQAAANQDYVTFVLGRYICLIEDLLNRALGLTPNRRVHFDTSPLLRMDEASQVTVLSAAVSGSIMSPNEARARMGLPPVPGGESPLSQQQYYSLAALGKRDSQPDPFGSAAPEPAATQPEPNATQDEPTPEELAAAAKAIPPDDISEGGKLFLKSLEPARWQAKWDGVYWQRMFRNEDNGELSCHWVKKREQPPLAPTLEPEITAWAEVRPTTHLMPRADSELDPAIADYLHDVEYLHHVEEEIAQLME